jgi:hypothetical protein
MGGVITRHYKQSDGSKLRKYITMGSPLEGTIYGYLAAGNYTQSRVGMLAKILKLVGVQNQLEQLGPIGGFDSQAAPQLANPQAELGLWDNLNSAVAGDPDYLAIAGTKIYGAEGLIDVATLGTGQGGALLMTYLPGYAEMIGSGAHQRRLWMDTLVNGSDGLAAFRSAAKREVNLVASLYVEANHTGYNRTNSLPGVVGNYWGGNGNLVSMLTSIDSFFKGSPPVSSYTTVAPLTPAQQTVRTIADTKDWVIKVDAMADQKVKDAYAAIRIGAKEYMAEVAASSGQVFIRSQLVAAAISTAIARGQVAELVLKAPNYSERAIYLGGGSAAAQQAPGPMGQHAMQSAVALAVDQVVLPTQVTLQLEPGYDGPLGGSILINNQADTTSSATLTLTIAATNATEMRLQVEGALREWEPYATQKSVVLQNTDPGIKSVSVEFRSSNGTIGSGAYDTILFVPATGTGTIRVTGHATPGVRILVDEVDRVADGSGLITSVMPGTHTVRMSADGYVFSPDIQTVTVTGGNTTDAAFTVASATVAPSVVSDPAAATVIAGGAATFECLMAGSPAPTLQWQVSANGGSTWAPVSNGGGYAGATTGLLAITGATAGMNGYRYRCVATNTAGGANSSAATLTVNVLPAIATQPSSQTTTAGGIASFTAAASGTPAPTLKWQVSTNGGSTWSDVPNGAVYSGAGTGTLTISGATAAMNGYQYRGVATNTAGVTTSSAVTLAVTSSRVVNLSVRSVAGTGSQTLIVGLVISGTGNKTLLLRGLGPALQPLGVANALGDPRMRLLNLSGGEVAANNDWGGSASMAANFTAVGASSLSANSKDAAIYNVLTNGLYSFHVFANDSGTGVTLAELYDADAVEGTATVVNISARSQVGTGENILIAGFVITGNAPKTLLIRGLGPSLVPAGVSGALGDPVLYLFRGGTVVGNNDDWRGTSALKSAFVTVGASSLVSDTSYDAALLVTLDPGVYSAQVSGYNSTTGVGLVEIFLMP